MTGALRRAARAHVALAFLGAASLAAQQNQPPPGDSRLARLVPPSPVPSGFIADMPDVIPPAAQAALNARIEAVQDSGWGDIGVAILPSIGDYEPYEVGVAVYRTWRIGRIDSIGGARRDLGVLLLLVPKELAPDGRGSCWITTGLGAEGIITDGIGGDICRLRVIPHMVRRDYSAAVAEAVDAISERVRGDQAMVAGAVRPAPARPLLPDPGYEAGILMRLAPVLVIGGLGAVGLAVFGALRWRRARPRRCPRCSRQMRRLDERQDDDALKRGQQMEESLGSVDYDVWECECGERLVAPYRAWFTRYRDCRKCGVRAVTSRRVILKQPTKISTGLAETTYHCQSCDDRRVERSVLPVIVESSSHSGGGRSSGGGGGSSFGGSGRTSGGGGGGRY